MPEVLLRLTVRDLTAADLPACAWAGGSLHVAAMARELERAGRGEVNISPSARPPACRWRSAGSTM